MAGVDKSPEAFRTISEVADWLGVQAHVLRFWESKFTQVKPVKRAGGRRYYRPADMLLIGGIKRLLHDDGMTIKGVQKVIREQGVTHVASLSQSLDELSGLMSVDGETASAEETVVQLGGSVKEPSEPELELEPSTAVAAADPSSDEIESTEDVVPAFRRKSRETEPDAPVQTSPDPIVEEAELPYRPGLLARLSEVSVLTEDQTRALNPIVEQLRAWRAGAESQSQG